MSDNLADNLENDFNELNVNNNFDINVDKNLLDDATNESPSLKNGLKLLLRLTIGIQPIHTFILIF